MEPDPDFMKSSSDDEIGTINGNTIDPCYMVESHIFDKDRFGFCPIEDGEKEIDFVNLKVIDIFEAKQYSGQLCLTRYKLVFKPFDDEKKYEVMQVEEDLEDPNMTSMSNLTINNTYLELPEYKKRYFTIPVHLLYKVTFNYDKKNIHMAYIDIDTKDFRRIRFQLDDHNKAKEL